MRYIVYADSSKVGNQGGSKMIKDMVESAAHIGYQPCLLYRVTGLHIGLNSIVFGFMKILLLFFKFRNGDFVLLPFPLNRQLMFCLFDIIKAKKSRAIVMIHDIDFLRGIPLQNKGVVGMKECEVELLKKADCIIAPNDCMIKKLKSEGLTIPFISQGISDYIYRGEIVKRTKNPIVIIAGNLDPQKAGYIYKMKPMGYKLALYGDNVAKVDDPNIEYMGSFSPDKLILHLNGNFGLVWDGDSLDGCFGSYGQYQQFNNPHKLSLYLAAGLPVIVWKKAALSSFVTENKVGLVIDSLDQIEDAIKRCNLEELYNNVDRVRNEIVNGDTVTEAIKKAESILQV